MSNLGVQSQPSKKPYHAPKLEIYGNIRNMTLANQPGVGGQDSVGPTLPKTQAP